MAKQLQNVSMYVSGSPSASDPSTALVSYDVVDGSMKKTDCIYAVPSPDWSKTADQFWDDVVTAIKSAEGIA